MISALERAGAALRSIARLAARLAFGALVAGAVVWWALWAGFESGPDRQTMLIVAAVVLAAPPAVLLYTAWALRQLTEIPTRLREAPATIRGRVEEVRRRAAQASEAKERGAFRRGLALVRLWRAVSAFREEAGALSPLVVGSGALVAGIVAAGFATVELLAGVVALLWLAAR